MNELIDSIAVSPMISGAQCVISINFSIIISVVLQSGIRQALQHLRVAQALFHIGLHSVEKQYVHTNVIDTLEVTCITGVRTRVTQAECLPS